MSELKLPLLLSPGVYELLDELGSGGMATVYRAQIDLERFDYAALLEARELSRSQSRRVRRSQELGQRYAGMTPRMLRLLCDSRGVSHPTGELVAVKVLNPCVRNIVERFVDEWLGLLGVAGSHVVAVYGGGHDAERDLYYYAMELVEERLSEEELIKLTLLEKLEIISQAADGIQVLHEHGMVHRDLKPDNLICRRDLDGNVVAKVGDLGIAKDVHRSVELTMTNQVMGTPCFMAPELARGAAGATVATDVYSLGATLYTLLSGRAPYHDKGLHSILGFLGQGVPPVAIAELVPVAAPVEDLVESLMAFEPTNRPLTMADVGKRARTVAGLLRGNAKHATADYKAPPLPRLAAARPCQILVVDDDVQLQRMLRRRLVHEGADVTVASNGAEALLKVGHQRFDLILSDLNMPVLGGLALMSVLKAQSIDTPVALLTSWPTPDVIREATELGAIAVLDKRFIASDLVALVERFISPPRPPTGPDSTIGPH